LSGGVAVDSDAFRTVLFSIAKNGNTKMAQATQDDFKP
jgi:hypothetical protein